MMHGDEQCDVAVIGGGSAAFEAAVAARQAGAEKVVMLEKAPIGDLGNARYSHTNTSKHPIDRLYASGDIVGLFFHNYPSCTGEIRNAVFSRTAGRNAAETAN